MKTVSTVRKYAPMGTVTMAKVKPSSLATTDLGTAGCEDSGAAGAVFSEALGRRDVIVVVVWRRCVMGEGELELRLSLRLIVDSCRWCECLVMIERLDEIVLLCPGSGNRYLK